MIKYFELCRDQIGKADKFKISLSFFLLGCRVIQKCIERGNKFQKLDLVTLIVANTLQLINYQFGTYVVKTKKISFILQKDIDFANTRVQRRRIGGF